MGFSLACRNSGCLAPLNELQEELHPPRTSLVQKGVRDLQSAARGAKNLARIIRNSPFIKKVEGKIQGSLGLVSMPLSLLQLPLLQAAVDQASAEDAASNGLDIAGEGTNSAGATTTPPPPDDDKDKDLSKEDRKSIRSLEKQIEKHEQKLADFKNNPSVRPGMENQPEEVIQAQRATRIRHLETEIRTFQNNIDKIRGGQ